MRAQETARAELVFQRRQRRAHQQFAAIAQHEFHIVSRRCDGEHFVQPHAIEPGAVADVESERLARHIDELLLAQQMLDQREPRHEQRVSEYILTDFVAEIRPEAARAIVISGQPIDERAQLDEAPDMDKGKQEGCGDMGQKLPARAGERRREPVADPGNPEEGHQRDPA